MNNFPKILLEDTIKYEHINKLYRIIAVDNQTFALEICFNHDLMGVPLWEKPNEHTYKHLNYLVLQKLGQLLLGKINDSYKEEAKKA